MSRVALLVLLDFAGLSVLSPIQQLCGLEHVTVDLSLAIVLYVALFRVVPFRGAPFRVEMGIDRGLGALSRWIEPSGLCTAVLVGYVTDLLAGVAKGAYGVSFALVYLLARVVSRHVYVDRLLPQFLFTATASCIATLLAALFHLAAHGVGFGWRLAAAAIAQGVLTGAVAPLIIRGLQTVEGRLLRQPRRQGMASP